MPVTNDIWDEVNDTLLMEKDEAGNTTAAYTYEPGQYGPLISQRRGGQTSHYHSDGQGSTRQLTDANQNVTDSATYTAFGEMVASSGTTTNPFGYKGALGYYANPETEDIYVRSRIYQPRHGRWASTDPLGVLDEADLYNYVRGNPANLSDPSGWCCCCCITSTSYAVKRLERPEPSLGTNMWGHVFTHTAVIEFVKGEGQGKGCQIEWYECPSQKGSLGQEPETWNAMHGKLGEAITNWDEYQQGKIPFDCPGGSLTLFWTDEAQVPFPLSQTVKFAIKTRNEAGCKCPRHNMIEFFTQRLHAKPGAKFDPFFGTIRPNQYDRWEWTTGVSANEVPKKCGSGNVPGLTACTTGSYQPSRRCSAQNGG